MTMEVAPGVFAHIEGREVGTDPRVPLIVVRSDGLRALGHRELAFPLGGTLARAEDAHGLVPLLRAIAGAARQGQHVEAGGITRLGAPILGRFDGVVYARPSRLDGLVAADGLIGLFATRAELDAVERFGLRRWLSRRARASCYYPYPPWTEPSQPSCAEPGDAQSMLEQVPRFGTMGASVTRVMRAGTAFTELRLDARADLSPLRSAPANAAMALLVNEVDPDADGCLVWSAGQQAPAGVAPPGSRGLQLGGCFLLLVPEQPQNASQLLEDGVTYFLRDEDAARVREALVERRDVDVRGAAAGDDLLVRWRG